MANSTILVVDSEKSNWKMLKDVLGSDYDLLEADNGAKALELMRRHKKHLAAVLVDMGISAGIDGYEILRQWQEDMEICDIPIIAAIHRENPQDESKCLNLGAWDFIYKPYEPEVTHFRIQNVVERSESSRHMQEYDELTGIYNRNMFLRKTEEMLQRYPQEKFVFIHLDINKFQLVNQFYGLDEGDRLIRYIADLIAGMAEQVGHFTYGRYLADVFCVCMTYRSKEGVINTIKQISEGIGKYNIEHVLEPVFGLYEIESPQENVIEISDKANLASKQCKGNYIQNFAFYDASLNEQIVREQRIINSMRAALEEEQFVLYIQPKYDLHTNTIDGGEVLVRWIVPDRGMISPGEFIPVFERNGFITKLDYYVWEHACQNIRRWLDEGREPYPVSVNISRVSLYNPKLAEIIRGLVDQYGIPQRLLQLELTESAYTSNPVEIKETMSKLQEYGFCILMDDFGSGYSSLNALKDIAVDILKIDMKFLDDTDMPGRGENILASVVRMAKWLNMPVIAEGVEKESQVAFLRSIGCEFVQGYYFAKPMPVAEYEQLAFTEFNFHREQKPGDQNDADKLWDASSQMEILFSNMLQAVAVYEYVPGEEIVDTIRVNNSYYDLFGYSDLDRVGNGIQNAVDADYRETVLNAFETVARAKGVTQCEFRYTHDKEKELWVEMKLKYINSVGNRSVIFATMTDITDQKEVERELRKYRKAIISSANKVETFLIVDDMEMNRHLLRIIFESEYNILEAENGQEALEIARKNCHHIDLILLDVMMPVMDGREFLQRKNEDINIADIPVIIITSDDSPQRQIDALSMGANDYIVKPFIPEVVIRRVCNVLESQKRVGEVLQQMDSGDLSDRHDHLTGLYNRNVAGQMIHEVLQSTEGLQALLMIDIDNFNYFNERYGHVTGDKVIQEFAESLRGCFRKSDILARYGGDEFIVFVIDVPSREFIEKKCDALIQEMRLYVHDAMELDCSIGIATAAAGEAGGSFMEMLGHADEALYEAKHRGKNQWCIYEGN